MKDAKLISNVTTKKGSFMFDDQKFSNIRNLMKFLKIESLPLLNQLTYISKGDSANVGDILSNMNAIVSFSDEFEVGSKIGGLKVQFGFEGRAGFGYFCVISQNGNILYSNLDEQDPYSITYNRYEDVLMRYGAHLPERFVEYLDAHSTIVYLMLCSGALSNRK